MIYKRNNLTQTNKQKNEKCKWRLMKEGEGGKQLTFPILLSLDIISGVAMTRSKGMSPVCTRAIKSSAPM